MAYLAGSDLPQAGSCDAIFVIASTALAVRQGLRDILCHPIMAQLSADARGSAEVVLAEALNNIVEHAYDRVDGQIDLHLKLQSGRLMCDICDDGVPMPNCELPTGLAQTIGADDDLPEGGFGWFLIRSMTDDLAYRRIDARNHLSFQLNVEQ
jgi:serine/threonine-protein kinase RsbW